MKQLIDKYCSSNDIAFPIDIDEFIVYYDITSKKIIVDKTFIILNGGTTNNNESQLGTMNQYLQTLVDNEIKIETFHEPDLGNQLTAIVFLVDERVFNRIKYPDFETSVLGSLNTWKYKREYKGCIKKIGGEKNVFLRNFLKNFRLA